MPIPNLHWDKNEFCQKIAYPRGLTLQGGIDFYCRVHGLTSNYDPATNKIHFRKKGE